MSHLCRARVAALLVAFAAGTTTACTPRTDIGDLLNDAERYEGREVKVRGRVSNSMRIPFVDIRTYIIEDGTGEMVVLTSGSLPQRGDRVTVSGTFNTLGSVNGSSLGPHIRQAGTE